AGVVAGADPLANDPNPTTGKTCNDPNGCYTADTVASCMVELVDFGTSNAFPINACSFPSGQPNSNSFDCVVTPNNGFLTIVKEADPNDGTAFEFDLGPNQSSQDGSTSWSINGSG